jgi:predicted RNA binding protein YcfA (HicA-like mRNA interferase family)
MAQLDKLIAALRGSQGSFSFRDLAKILRGLGYVEVKTGKTGGSRRRYHNPSTGHLILLHAPHGDEMPRGMVDRLRNELSERGVL